MSKTAFEKSLALMLSALLILASIPFLAFADEADPKSESAPTVIEAAEATPSESSADLAIAEESEGLRATDEAPEPALGTQPTTPGQTASSEQSGESEQVVEPQQPAEPCDMYRVYNRWSGEHFYTASTEERDHLVTLGWFYEGIGWVAPTTSQTPVHRLYNSVAGDHHYTTDVNERDYLQAEGWTYEGIGWYSDDGHTVALYRQYNPNAFTGTHNYTTSLVENDSLCTSGWIHEGESWYALEVGTPGSTGVDIGIGLGEPHWQALLGTSGGPGIQVTGGTITGDQRARMQSVIDRGTRIGGIALNTRTGKCVAYNADEYFYSASAIKVTLVAGLCRYDAPNIGSWRQTLYNVITHSDNGAYKQLMWHFGRDWVNRLACDAGIGNLDFNRGSYLDISPRQLARLWAEIDSYLVNGGPWHDMFVGLFGNGGFFKEGWMGDDFYLGRHYNIGAIEGDVLYVVMSGYNYKEGPFVQFRDALVESVR